jgi:3-isopropylmalate dehydrogenase
MKLVAIDGDGIGPETVGAGIAVLEAAAQMAGARIEIDREIAGHASLERFGTTVREELVRKVEASDGLILGPMTTHDLDERIVGQINPSKFFRKHFDLFANIRPAKTYPGMPNCTDPFDLVIVRENTEGFYADRNMTEGNAEILVTPDVAISMRRITRQCCERIARAAFELAMTRRRHVTLVHKANVLKLGDGMFLQACRVIAKSYPQVLVQDVIVDAMMAHVVRDPDRFDVIVTTNMFGDILSDLTAQLSGSLGMAGSINSGESFAMAQAAHGSAPDIAGRNIANPLSQVLSISMLLAWYSQRMKMPIYAQVAHMMEVAVQQCVADKQLTVDLGGQLGTHEVGDAVIQRLTKEMQ